MVPRHQRLQDRPRRNQPLCARPSEPGRGGSRDRVDDARGHPSHHAVPEARLQHARGDALRRGTLGSGSGLGLGLDLGFGFR